MAMWLLAVGPRARSLSGCKLPYETHPLFGMCGRAGSPARRTPAGGRTADAAAGAMETCGSGSAVWVPGSMAAVRGAGRGSAGSLGMCVRLSRGVARFAGGERNAASSCSGWMTAAAGPCGGWHLPVWARARVQAVIFWRSLSVTRWAGSAAGSWTGSWTGRRAHWVRSVLSERLGVRSVQLVR